MKKNVALVLSAGGARGFAHIGVIEELEKRGYQITSVAGTSMGALVAGIYSTGKISEFKQWALQLNKSEVYR
ncbi:MAG: patatin-like phospholipase family protein, partial [Bacteroidales bacterium]|nr:patatin-like phospholipase family protein [Bacteroidales bacterium]